VFEAGVKDERQHMKHRIHKVTLATAAALAFAFALQTGHAAQQQNNSQQNQAPTQQQTQQPSSQNGKPSLGEPQTPANGQAAPANGQAPAAAAAPKVDPAEESAYQAFAQLKPDDYDQQIQQGEDFAKKYPQSRYNEIVYSRLVTAYYNKQETDKMYDASDKALAINPNNLQVLALVGWVIPHNFNPNDPNSDKQLQKSEAYEQRALQILSTLTKPPNLTDEQFTAAKAQEASLAHSGLGLTYFREQKADDSLKELQQATATDKPDPVDLFIMGVDLDSLKRYNDAAQAFDKCAQIPGVMQSRCTEQETKAKAEAAQPAK
jgi:tetratricopeptide (TPR) repeat protein